MFVNLWFDLGLSGDWSRAGGEILLFKSSPLDMRYFHKDQNFIAEKIHSSIQPWKTQRNFVGRQGADGSK